MPTLAPIQVQGPTPPTPPALPAVAEDGNALAAQALQSQIRELSGQLREKARERESLNRQLQGATGPEAGVLRAQVGALNADMASLTGSISQTAERLAQMKIQQAIQSTGFARNFQPGPPMIDPDAITAVFVIFSIGVIVPLSVGLTRRLWRRPPHPAAPPRDGEIMPSARLERLEQAVDAIAIEVERISESQRFITKVLSERTIPSRPSAGTDAKNEAAGIGEPAPFLALGAGPVEPIRAAERQTVRSSVTPH